MSQKKTNLNEKFTFGETLGKGSFATVVYATDNTTKKHYAMKIIDKQKCRGQEDHIVKEITILKRLNHKNIISLYDVYETKDKLYLQMEYVDGGELFERIVAKTFYTEQDARQIVIDILEAINYLHSQNIVHRDLKPENLLMATKADDAPVKLADFGLSTVVNTGQLLRTSCGTLTYVAPEVLNGEGYGYAVDMWSIGVITYILLSGYPPFYGDDDASVLELTSKGEFRFFSPEWDEVSTEAKDFITKLIQVNPSKRMSASEALKHPWIVKAAGQQRKDRLQIVGDNLVKHFNAKRKLKAGVEAIILAQRLSKNISSPNVSPLP